MVQLYPCQPILYAHNSTRPSRDRGPEPLRSSARVTVLKGLVKGRSPELDGRRVLVINFSYLKVQMSSRDISTPLGTRAITFSYLK